MQRSKRLICSPLEWSLKLRPSGIGSLRWQPVSAAKPFRIDRIVVRGSAAVRGWVGPDGRGF